MTMLFSAVLMLRFSVFTLSRTADPTGFHTLLSITGKDEATLYAEFSTWAGTVRI